jgi:hypothetical protein
LESTFQLALDGQAVQKSDLDTLGETAGLADDRVLASLFALAPLSGSTVSRGILPLTSSPLIAPNGATGSVKVNAFRAFVGSRTAEASDARENLRGIRSGLSVAAGASAIAATVVLGPNASGQPRWDLVYATVTPDAPSSTVTRKVTSTVDGAITSQPVAPFKVTTVTLAVAAGTPSATPDWPALPADPAGAYRIPLGYVLVPDAFDATDTVNAPDIAITAPVLAVSDSTGACATEPANTTTALTAAEQHAWAAGFRPARYMPSTMTGGSSLIVPIDLTTGAVSHASGAVVDSRDWRNRVFQAAVSVSAGTAKFAWVPGGAASDNVPDAIVEVFYPPSATGNYVAMAMGQTVKQDDVTPAQTVVCRAAPGTIAGMPAGSRIDLYVDHADGGKLKVFYTGAPNCRAFFWIHFSGVFENAI